MEKIICWIQTNSVSSREFNFFVCFAIGRMVEYGNLIVTALPPKVVYVIQRGEF